MPWFYRDYISTKPSISKGWSDALDVNLTRDFLSWPLYHSYSWMLLTQDQRLVEMIWTGKKREATVDHNSNQPIHVAILKISGHIEIIWTFVWYLYHQLHFMHGQIYHSFPKSSVWPSAATYDNSSIANGSHFGNWRPYWNYLNIWIVLITLTVLLVCISGKLIVAILENGGHFKILLGQLFSLTLAHVKNLCQIWCLYPNLNDSYCYLFR